VAGSQSPVCGGLNQPDVVDSILPGSTARYIELLGRDSFATFKDIPTLADLIDDIQKRLDRGEAVPQYVGVTGVTEPIFAEIEKKRDRGSHGGITLSKDLRFYYDSGEEILIIKVSTGVHHTTNRCLSGEITWQLRSVLGVDEMEYVWAGAGATRWTVHPNTNLTKEADESFLPRGRTYSNDSPSFVIEVGDIESLPVLRADAEFWLLNTEERCRMVLVVAIDSSSRDIALELYHRVHVQNRTEAGLVVPQTVIRKDGTVVGPGPPGFDIPLEALFDVVPEGLDGSKVAFTAEILRGIVDRVWRFVS
jgi:hypothetical protein